MFHVQSAKPLWIASLCFIFSSTGHGAVAVLSQAGSKHQVYTQNSFTTAGLYNRIFGPTYKLKGQAIAGTSEMNYETPWNTKLNVLGPTPIVYGVTQTESRQVYGEGWRSKAESGIKTTPLGLTLQGGPISLGLIVGAVAELSVTAEIESIDPHPDAPILAEAFVHDPFFFENLQPEDQLVLSSTLSSGDSLEMVGLKDSVVHRTLMATTDIPGLELLYQLEMVATDSGEFTGSQDDVHLEIDFSSNPVLGLSDDDVIGSLISAMQYDSAIRGYSLSSDFTIFGSAIDIPDSVSAFSLSITEHVSATVVAVPEPGTFGFLLTATITTCSLGGHRRRRTKTSSARK